MYNYSVKENCTNVDDGFDAHFSLHKTTDNNSQKPAKIPKVPIRQQSLEEKVLKHYHKPCCAK